MQDRIASRSGASFAVTIATSDDHDDLFRVFHEIVARDEGFVQDPTQPLARSDFEAFWLTPGALVVVARSGDDGTLCGSYTMRPNGVGRAAHVANAGYLVAPHVRRRGLAEALVLHSFDAARERGFDALQFNFVFESNPARAMYERLGFRAVGCVPNVIGTQAVYIYHRQL
jgi:ribosomal protein S18 acetylase RimI-like enzyme